MDKIHVIFEVSIDIYFKHNLVAIFKKLLQGPIGFWQAFCNQGWAKSQNIDLWMVIAGRFGNILSNFPPILTSNIYCSPVLGWNIFCDSKSNIPDTHEHQSKNY